MQNIPAFYGRKGVEEQNVHLWTWKTNISKINGTAPVRNCNFCSFPGGCTSTREPLSSVPCFVTVFVFSVNVVFFMCQAETRFWYFLSPPLPYGYSHSTPVENLGCWPPCLITSTGVKIPSTRTTVGTDSLPLPSLELAPHQRPWQNTTATCASRACLVPSTDKCGEVYQVH